MIQADREAYRKAAAMSQEELHPARIPFIFKVKLIGRTACFCYFSVPALLAICNGRGILEEMKESGFLFVLGGLAVGSGLLSLVSPGKKKAPRA